MLVEEAENEVRFDMYLKLNWRARKWIGISDDEFQGTENRFKDDWWAPGVEITNAIEAEKQVEDQEECFWVEFPDEGILAYTQRYSASVYAPMDLRLYPYDRQIFPITFESFHWKASDMTLLRLKTHALQYSPDVSRDERWLTMSDMSDFTSYKIEKVEVLETEKTYRFEDRTYSQIYVKVHLLRIYWRLIMRYCLVIALLAMMSWAAFGMDPERGPKRLLILSGVFVAMVAFQIERVTEDAAKVPYNTRLEWYLFISYFFVIFPMLETVISYNFRHWQNDKHTADWVDWGSAIGSAIAFLLFNLIWLSYPIYDTIKTSYFSNTRNDKPPTNRF